jgi:hypothetical protein
MQKLIGVYNADGGLAGELSYFFGHLVGLRHCTLCDITHSPIRKKSQWKAFEERLRNDLGVEFVLVHKNERTPEQLAASEGREPCVLIQDDTGDISMIMDWNDLKFSRGDVAKFEEILRAKLLMY